MSEAQNRTLIECKRCHVEKRPDQFDLTFTDVRKSTCKQCRLARQRYLRENKFDVGYWLAKWRKA